MFGRPRDVAVPGARARHLSRRWLPFLLAVLVIGPGGPADAYWKSSGDAPGSGATGTTLPLVMSPGTPSAALRPGGQADVVLTISNANREPVPLASLALDPSRGASGLSVDTAHATCDPSSLTFVTQTAGWIVPARSGSVDGSLTVDLVDSISMAVDASDSCQGAQFGIFLRSGS